MIFPKLRNGGAQGVRTPDLLNAIQEKDSSQSIDAKDKSKSDGK
jgi:hypothetical protein